MVLQIIFAFTATVWEANPVEINPTLLLASPFSLFYTTSGLMPGFWFISDGHCSFYEGNNNFSARDHNAGNSLSQQCVDGCVASSAGSVWADFKGVIYLTVEFGTLQHMWAVVIFPVNLTYCIV